jgi:hypothetical protein
MLSLLTAKYLEGDDDFVYIQSLVLSEDHFQHIAI